MPEPYTPLRLNRPTARLAKPPLPHSRARHRPRCLAPHATPTPPHSHALQSPAATSRKAPPSRKTSPPHTSSPRKAHAKPPSRHHIFHYIPGKREVLGEGREGENITVMKVMVPGT